MDAIQLLEGYTQRMKAGDKELKRLERKSKALAKKQAEIYVERTALEEDIRNRERSIAALESEREQLRGDFAEASFENDVQEQRRISARRTAIDNELQEHQQAIRVARESLDGLAPSLEREAAQVAGEIDALNFGNGAAFYRELETAIRENQDTLTRRAHDARSKLPTYSREVYEDIRRANDDEYRAEQERKEARAAALTAMQHQKEQRAKLTKRAIVNDDGYLQGYDILDENGIKQRFEPIKKVPITQH